MDDVLHHGAVLAEAKALCVFVHGRGQSPEDMVHQVIRHLPQDVAYALPRATGKSWYAARAVDALTDTTTAELSAAVAQVSRVIVAQRASSSLPLLLAGFSQGACVALELACSGQSPPDALAACTGCRVGAATDSRPTALPRGLPVYLTGGDDDPWISIEAFGQAVTDLGRQGAALRADLFPARAHEVSHSEIAMLSAMLLDLSQARAPRLAASR